MKKLILSTLIAVTALTASAVPAKRGPYRTFRADGTEMMVQRVGDERGSWFLDMEGNLLRRTTRGFEYAAFDSEGELIAAESPRRFSRSMLPSASTTLMSKTAAPNLGRFPGNSFPSTGKQKAIVVLVDFPDMPFQLGDNAKQYITDMLNKKGFNEYNGTGCANEYFLEMSSGKFDCEFDVYGPVTLPNNYSYYGKNKNAYTIDTNAYQMAIHACDALDGEVDFSEYDRDNDGYIDNVYIFFAGEGEASAYPANANLVWPHAWNVTYATKETHKYDGKILDSYGCTNEWIKLYEETRTGYKLVAEYPDGVGTFVHEFSHILGLPDLYLTDESELGANEDGYFTPGEWSVMDYGPYNNDGRTPPAYSAFERNAMGWMETEDLTAETTEPRLTHIAESNHAYSICNPKKSTEFYLLECRKRSGWDEFIPGDGMLVWHIDYDNYRWTQNTVNNKGSHQYVDLVEADGIAEKTFRTAGDCFPGKSKVTSLATKWWDNTSTGIKLSEIALNADKTITFNVESTDVTEDYGSWITVEQVLAAPMNGNQAAVRGYIVGYVKAGTFSQNGVVFGNDNCQVNTNVVIADTPDASDLSGCIPVQLNKNSDARNDLNLKENPETLGRQVELYGNLQTYMAVPGLKSVSIYKFIGDEPSDEPGDDNSSITEISADTDKALFDLQGRRVTSPRHGSIYISGGKKIRF